MKKKIMSIITAAGMLLTLAVPMTAHAEESASIWETYTFEEFLELSEEEVCAITCGTKFPDGMQHRYEYAEYNCENALAWGHDEYCRIHIYMEQDMIDKIKADPKNPDYELLIAELRLPPELFYRDMLGYDITDAPAWVTSTDGGGSKKYGGFVLTAYWDVLNQYGLDESEVFAKTYIWLVINPSVVFAGFEEYAAGDIVEPDAVCGDVNIDGKVSVLDIIMLSKYDSQIITLNESQLQAADCNADGAINSADLTALMSYLVGLSESLPSA